MPKAQAAEWPADKVERRAVASLVPYARNSRTHSDSQIAAVAASIREFGFTVPVLVDPEGTIIAGHCRVLAAQRLKLAEVPVMVARGWTDAQRRAYVIADNQLATQAGWNNDLLRIELADLQTSDFDLTLTGFDPGQLGDFIAGKDIETPAVFDGPGATRHTAGADDEAGGPLGASPHDGDRDPYSRKIEAPIYEPLNEKPAPTDLYDDTKADEMTAEIQDAGLPYEVERFLTLAAQRHTVFNFAKIADFYAHSEPHIQRLMERSALVIVDFDKAIENGFVSLTGRLAQLSGMTVANA